VQIVVHDPEKRQHRLEDYMGSPSSRLGGLYLNTRARGMGRYLLEQGAQALLSWIPGLPGMGLRALGYRPLFGDGSHMVFVEPRVELFRMDSIRLGKSVYIDSGCRLHASEAAIELGDNCRVMRNAYLCTCVSEPRPGEGIVTAEGCWIGVEAIISSGQGGIVLGRNVLVGPRATLVTGGHDFRDNHLSTLQQRYSGQAIRVGDNVWIGAHSVILGGVTIGDRAVVAAGAVVTSDVPPLTVVGGVPAKPIGNLTKNGGT
jgi:acetyltransferase-like isoleucine patch superfamily enzyme